MRRRLFLLALPALSACANWADDVAGPSVKTLAAPVTASQGLADRYIVVFRDDVQNPDALTDALSAQFGGTVHFRYANAIKGFAATLPAPALDGISRNPNVAYIEPDGIVAASVTDNTVSSWGLDRIDQRDLPLSGSYTYTSDGTGVRAYIIDTGIRLSHTEFGGRASFGFDAFGGTGADCNGHGTHVAGTVGGGEYGVARSVSLVAVRVLDCGGSGTTSGVIAGINWVAGQSARPAVANMSLGGGYSSSLNTAVSNAVAGGITFAVAAGNSNANACNYSPASTASALTVGATTSSDARASYSNYGTCVDLFAPGSGITSSWSTGDGATNTISGTSMASPHVAGVAALYLSATGNSSKSPADVAAAIKAAATVGKVTNPGSGSPNLLLYNVFGTSQPPAGFTLTASAYKVRGLQTVDLSWSGASAAVDIYRDGARIVTGTTNDGAHTDSIGVKGGGMSYTYKVCNTGTATCSNNVTVNF
ncbi:MAG TPA: S8 family peptidase [Gemmatimonadaceae bacterium]